MPPIPGWAVPVPTNMETSSWDGLAWDQWAQTQGKQLGAAFERLPMPDLDQRITLVYPFDPEPCRRLEAALGVANIVNWDEFARRTATGHSTRVVLVGKQYELAGKVSFPPHSSCAYCLIG